MREKWPEVIEPAARRLALLMKAGAIAWVLYYAALTILF